jgi:hypothetical protein
MALSRLTPSLAAASPARAALVTGVLTGAGIQQMDDLALAARVEQVNLPSEAAPIRGSSLVH